MAFVLFIGCTNTNDEDELQVDVVITASDFSVTIPENPTQGQVLGVLDATASEGQLSFSITTQSVQDAIAVNADGELSVADPQAFDFETNTEITAIINASVANASRDINITITIDNVAEGVDGLVANNFITKIFEGPTQDQEIGTINASSTAGSVSFRLLSQTPENAISLGSSTGLISVADPSLFVFSDNPLITASVEATDQVDTLVVNVSISVLEGVTIWDGPLITFTKASGADPNDAVNQDRLTSNVWLTRRNNGGPIINIQSSENNDNGPGGTEWAAGTTADLANLEFSNLRNALGGGRTAFRNAAGKQLVLHLIEDDIYLNLRITQWSSGQAGGFAYERASQP